jgi:ABC-type xylose transport system substrate-binding protein
MNMRKMQQKVFHGLDFVNGKQVSVVVAASSQRAAVEALRGVGLNVTVRHVADYWNVTGNKDQCATALAAPGEVFASSSLDSRDYKALPKRPLPPPSRPHPPKIPKDPEGFRQYTKARREDSDENKRKRGERRVSTWIPKDAAEALDQLTGGSKERGAVQSALVAALKFAAQQGAVAA